MQGRLRAVLVPAVCALACTGCLFFLAGAAAGAGAVVWMKGGTRRTYNEPYDKVWKASCDAIRDLGYADITERHGAELSQIQARRVDDALVTVQVQYRRRLQTRVNVKLGSPGGRPGEVTVVDAITVQLSR